MQAARTPEDEAGRIAALRGYEVLDTLPEQAYDDIVDIAAHICDSPIALVSLVDTDRQWFKAKLGLDVPETPRDLAFCAHAILEPQALLVVEDAMADPRFAENPFVTAEPGIRFYAGAPLVTAEGHALGTLCVIDRRPRTLSPEQAGALQALSRQVVAQLELRRTVAEVERGARELRHSHADLERRTQQIERSRDHLAGLCRILESQADVIERDLHRAETIQRSLLPHAVPHIPDFCVQALYRPGHSIGGDLYDVLHVADRWVALVIADAAGHGVSAAMLSLLFKHRLEIQDEETGEPYRPAAALARINTALAADIPAPGVFVTAAFCLLDTRTRELAVASAGHPPVLWLRADGSTERIENTGPALGLFAEADFGERRLVLEPGDRLLLYTDGLFDLGGASPPTAARIAEALRPRALDRQRLEQVLVEVSGGLEREDRDDVTMLLLDARPGESHFCEVPADLEIAPAVDEDRPRITHAESVTETFLALEGRVTWVLGQTLLDAAAAVIAAGRPLVIDLGECQRLDSTLLGTLHELVHRADSAGTALWLQRASSDLRAAFAELSMNAVLDHLAAEPYPLPEQRKTLEPPEADLRRQRLRLLKAHEVLADLSAENRAQFAGVLEALRADLATR